MTVARGRLTCMQVRARSSGVEHLTFNQRVDGSIPSGLTNNRFAATQVAPRSPATAVALISMTQLRFGNSEASIETVC